MGRIKRLIDHFNYMTSGEPEARSSQTGTALPAPPSRPDAQARPQTVSTPVARPAPGVAAVSLSTVIGTDLKTGRDIGITEAAKRQSCYVIGSNGTGKTNLLKTVIAADVQNGL
jgi:hypothetical protein